MSRLDVVAWIVCVVPFAVLPNLLGEPSLKMSVKCVIAFSPVLFLATSSLARRFCPTLRT